MTSNWIKSNLLTGGFFFFYRKFDLYFTDLNLGSVLKELRQLEDKRLSVQCDTYEQDKRHDDAILTLINNTNKGDISRHQNIFLSICQNVSNSFERHIHLVLSLLKFWMLFLNTICSNCVLWLDERKFELESIFDSIRSPVSFTKDITASYFNNSLETDVMLTGIVPPCYARIFITSFWIKDIIEGILNFKYYSIVFFHHQITFGNSE